MACTMYAWTPSYDYMQSNVLYRSPALAERDMNLCSLPSQAMASCSTASRSEKRLADRRYAVHHLLSQRREREAVRRRQIYLSKVKEAGEEKRWQTRGDQVMSNRSGQANSTNKHAADITTRLHSSTKEVERGSCTYCSSGSRRT